MMTMMNGNHDDYTLPKKRKSKNKRRFSDEQIKSLETIFESESKLEPRKKVQVARELGLLPRQVAIWFQNKRARYKSKQLERDYTALLADYHELGTRFKTLEKEKLALQVQVQKLNEEMRKSRQGNHTDGGDEAKRESESKLKAESFGINDELRPGLSLERSEHNIGALSDEDSCIKAEYFGLDEEPGLHNMVDPADSTLSSPEDWGSLESGGLLDRSGSSYQWWDVWS